MFCFRPLDVGRRAGVPGSFIGDPDRDNERSNGPEAALNIDPSTPAGAIAVAGEAPERAEVMRWRKAERARIIAARLALAPGDRQRRSLAIARHLDDMIGDVAGHVIGVYWPFRGEPNLRRWMEGIVARGATCALPVVIARQCPLVFRSWRPGEPMRGGIWNIPVPAEGADVIPDIVVAPVVGFDPRCYRLGYGGGFYDRTLAAMATPPRVIGVGFAFAAVPTIHPLPHDIAMDAIVTELGPLRPLGPP
jgi:5-formyltetrahydrofolate cyclo-ligase